jgi:hypothetical protein
MDITSVFGTDVPGSSPGGGTSKKSKRRRKRKKQGSELDSIQKGLIHAIMLFERIWFSGKTRPCQGRVGSSILPIRTAVRDEI